MDKHQISATALPRILAGILWGVIAGAIGVAMHFGLMYVWNEFAYDYLVVVVAATANRKDGGIGLFQLAPIVAGIMLFYLVVQLATLAAESLRYRAAIVATAWSATTVIVLYAAATATLQVLAATYLESVAAATLCGYAFILLVGFTWASISAARKATSEPR